MRRASKTKRFNINGHIVECYTISGLGLLVGKSRRTLVRYEDTGVMPKAIIVHEGIRYYPKSLAEALVPAIKALPGNTKPSAEQIANINRLFQIEREKYASKDN